MGRSVALRKPGLRQVRSGPVASGYVGARTDRPALQEWTPPLGSADTDLIDDLPALRARSRDLVRNSPLAAGAINTVVTNVVGTGLEPRPSIDADFLGLSEDEAQEWESRAQRIWWLWAAGKGCDIERSVNFAAMQDLVLRSRLESGDVFAIRRNRLRPGDVLSLKLMIVEADRVNTPFGMPDTRSMVDGVELGQDGEAVGYMVQDSHPGDLFHRGPDRWTRINAVSPRSGEWQTLHLYRKRRPGQKRGVPYLATVIEYLKQLTRYGDAEIMAAVLSAMFTVFIETETGEEGLATVVGVTDAKRDEFTAAGQVGLGNGAIVDLARGERPHFADPSRPNSNFDPFVVSMLRQIGPALEIPLEVLTKHFQSSYSAARAALLDAWKLFRTERGALVTDFCQPVYEAVIAESVARGLLDAPGFFEDPVARQAWCETEWHGPTPGQIDPLKEAQAAEIHEDRGWKTSTEITAELTGGDWDAKQRQRVRERNQREEAGLSPVRAPVLPDPPPVDEPTPERSR